MKQSRSTQNKPFFAKEDTKESLQTLKEFLSDKPRILIISHAGPDGDTTGASTALYRGLKNLEFPVSLACLDNIPEAFQFIKDTKEYKKDFDPEKFQGVVFVDCGDKKMTRFHDAHPEILSDEMFKINIDHHPTNDLFGDVNFVNTKASSSCEIVAELLKELEIKITPDIATCLLLGIYTDTGSFQHQNTTPKTYAMASELVKLGGNISKIAKNVFYNNEFKKFKLWGKVLKDLHLTDDGAAIIGVHKSDYESLGATRSDLQGVIDLVSSMPEAKYSVVLSEDEKGNVKASLRTRDPNIDVKALAERYGGGGHVKASGFTIPKGHLKKEVKWKIIQD